MKRLLLMTSAATLLMLGGCIEVTLGDDRPGAYRPGKQSLVGGDIRATLDEDGDLRVAGSDIVLRGRVGGRLRVAGSDFNGSDLRVGALELNAADVRFDGQVAGAARVNASDIRWVGPIGGDAVINAADMTFDGDLGGALVANISDGRFQGMFDSVTVNGADLVFSSGSRLSGDLTANASDIMLGADIDGQIDVSVRNIVITGTVEGPVFIRADPGRSVGTRRRGWVDISGQLNEGGMICARHVEISGRVVGALDVTADEAPVLTETGSAEQINFTPRNGQRCERR